MHACSISGISSVAFFLLDIIMLVTITVTNKAINKIQPKIFQILSFIFTLYNNFLKKAIDLKQNKKEAAWPLL